jgi:hypothetical protein
MAPTLVHRERGADPASRRPRHARSLDPSGRAVKDFVAASRPGRSHRRRRGHTFGEDATSPAGRTRTWRGFTPFAGPTMPSRSMRSMIFAALL